MTAISLGAYRDMYMAGDPEWEANKKGGGVEHERCKKCGGEGKMQTTPQGMPWHYVRCKRCPHATVSYPIAADAWGAWDHNNKKEEKMSDEQDITAFDLIDKGASTKTARAIAAWLESGEECDGDNYGLKNGVFAVSASRLRTALENNEIPGQQPCWLGKFNEWYPPPEPEWEWYKVRMSPEGGLRTNPCGAHIADPSDNGFVWDQPREYSPFTPSQRLAYLRLCRDAANLIIEGAKGMGALGDHKDWCQAILDIARKGD